MVLKRVAYGCARNVVILTALTGPEAAGVCCVKAETVKVVAMARQTPVNSYQNGDDKRYDHQNDHVQCISVSTITSFVAHTPEEEIRATQEQKNGRNFFKIVLQFSSFPAQMKTLSNKET